MASHSPSGGHSTCDPLETGPRSVTARNPGSLVTTSSMLPSAIDRNVPPVPLVHRQMRSTNGEEELRFSNCKNIAAPHHRFCDLRKPKVALVDAVPQNIANQTNP